MIKWLGLLILYSCAQVSPHSKRSDDVTLGAALNQARSSYLKGCVDAFHTMNISKQFEKCKFMAIEHEKELNNIIDVKD